MESEGPFPQYQLIFCRGDEEATTKIVSFADDVEVSEHARVRLLKLPDVWVSVVIARLGDEVFEFIGAWDRGHDGSLTWEAASLA